MTNLGLMMQRGVVRSVVGLDLIHDVSGDDACRTRNFPKSISCHSRYELRRALYAAASYLPFGEEK